MSIIKIAGLLMAAIIVISIVSLFIPSNSPKLGQFVSEESREDFMLAYNEAMAILPSPQESFDVETAYGSVRVYYFTKDENSHKEPIMLLHGRSASTPMWDANLAGLLEERPVYSVDLLGEPGMSIQKEEIADSQQQAEWLREVISKLELERVHLVGVSIGGWTAMNLVRFYPEAIASVSLLDPVFVFAPISLKAIAISIPASVPFVPKPIREKMLSVISGGAKTDDSQPVAKLIAEGMRNYKIKLPAPQSFSTEDLQGIEVPILALMAEKSFMHNSTKAVETGKSYVKNIEIENWKNASHAINGEFSAEVNARILEFVEKHQYSES